MRTLIIFAVFIFASNLIAQDDIGIGTYTLGGGISFTSSFEEDDDETASRLSISPSCYFFVSKYLALGGSVFFAYDEDGDLSSTSFGIGPGIKFYIHPHQKFKINLGLEYLFQKTEFDDDSSYPYPVSLNLDRTTTTWYLSFTAGCDIFISRNVALEPYINLRRIQRDYSNMDDLPWIVEATEGIRIAIFIF
ncbi:MAG: hypothetical protein P8Y99_15445 [Calditrichaceae bacterium]|jgi:hypothetical protein